MLHDASKTQRMGDEKRLAETFCIPVQKFPVRNHFSLEHKRDIRS